MTLGCDGLIVSNHGGRVLDGATAVMVGRPYIWGLATCGALGVAHVIRLLRDELELTMALTGCASLHDIS